MMCVCSGADLDFPDLGEFVQGQFTPQQLNDSLYSLTVLSLVDVTWCIKIFNDHCEYCQTKAKSHICMMPVLLKWLQSSMLFKCFAKHFVTHLNWIISWKKWWIFLPSSAIDRTEFSTSQSKSLSVSMAFFTVLDTVLSSINFVTWEEEKQSAISVNKTDQIQIWEMTSYRSWPLWGSSSW